MNEETIIKIKEAIDKSLPDFYEMDSYNRSFLQAMFNGFIDKFIEELEK